MGYLVATFGALLVLATSACSEPSQAIRTPTAEATPAATLAESPGARPFVPIPVDTPTRPAAVANVRACLATDLEGVFLKGSAATGGQLFAGASISNISATACRLDLPVVELVGPWGNVVMTVPVDTARASTCGANGPPFCVSAQPVLLLQGSWGSSGNTASTPGRADLNFSYRSDGPGGVPCPTRIATVVRLVLPAEAGTLDTATAPDFPWGLLVCEGSIGVTWFAPS